MAAFRVAVVDYGAGNLVSIDQALRAVGAEVAVVAHPADLRAARALLVPGVGAAAPAMRRLVRAGFDDVIREWVARDRPYLGICLGLQLLFDRSDEDGAETLGLIAGRTVRIPDAPTLPHIGWNQLDITTAHPALARVAADDDVYFVHSYAGAPAGDADRLVLAETEHGGRFVSAVARDNVLGLQFHPERSGAVGLRILADFVAWAA